jgi:tripartite-type tricarboxylate transporter receptor subunit TctC
LHRAELFRHSDFAFRKYGGPDGGDIVEVDHVPLNSLLARLIAAPELPTATELGLVGMNVIGSIGLLAPAGTPVEFIEQIAQATRTAVAEPAYQRLLIDAGIEPVLDSNPEKLRRTLVADVALWAPVVQKLGLKID